MEAKVIAALSGPFLWEESSPTSMEQGLNIGELMRLRLASACRNYDMYIGASRQELPLIFGGHE